MAAHSKFDHFFEKPKWLIYVCDRKSISREYGNFRRVTSTCAELIFLFHTAELCNLNKCAPPIVELKARIMGNVYPSPPSILSTPKHESTVNRIVCVTTALYIYRIQSRYFVVENIATVSVAPRLFIVRHCIWSVYQP